MGETTGRRLGMALNRDVTGGNEAEDVFGCRSCRAAMPVGGASSEEEWDLSVRQHVGYGNPCT